MSVESKVRCFGNGDALMERYHDEEWGVPETNPTTRRRETPYRNHERTLFGHLVLDGFQAGLSWRTILHKREAFRTAFTGFDPKVVAGFDGRDIRRLESDQGIVRNKLKIAAAIGNAQRFLETSDEYGGFDQYIWQFTNYRVLRSPQGVTTPACESAESEAMSKDLRQRGFKFVGSTICYAFMQAIGMVNDHMDSCWKAPPANLQAAQAARPTILLLTTTGRVSGKPRTRPLPFLEEGSTYAVIASNSGRDHHPDWFLNLKKSPEVGITLSGVRMLAIAREANPAEREKFWARQVARNAFYGELQKLTRRRIPVAILEPVKKPRRR